MGKRFYTNLGNTGEQSSPPWKESTVRLCLHGSGSYKGQFRVGRDQTQSTTGFGTSRKAPSNALASSSSRFAVTPNRSPRGSPSRLPFPAPSQAHLSSRTKKVWNRLNVGPQTKKLWPVLKSVWNTHTVGPKQEMKGSKRILWNFVLAYLIVMFACTYVLKAVWENSSSTFSHLKQKTTLGNMKNGSTEDHSRAVLLHFLTWKYLHKKTKQLCSNSSLLQEAKS